MCARVVFAIGLLLAISCRPNGSAGAKAAAVGALIHGFETLAYTDVIMLRHDNAAFNSSDSRALIAAPFNYLRRALDGLQMGAFNSLLTDSVGILAAAEDFRGPVGLGAVTATRCYVMVLRQGSNAVEEVLGPPRTVTEGMAVWEWSATIGEFGDRESRASALTLARIGSYIVVCNNSDKLRITVEALTNGSSTSTQQIGAAQALMRHDVWIYRQFRLPSDSPMAAGTSHILPNAEAMTLYTEQDSDTAVLRLIGSAPAQAPPYRRRPGETLPEFLRIDPRTWQLVITLDSTPESHEAMFGAMGLLGFVVYL